MKKSYLKKLISKGYMVIESECGEENKCSTKEIAALLKSFSSLGYTIGEEGINALSNLSSENLGRFYNRNYAVLQKLTGTDYNHRIFYNNFPDLSGISDDEFFIRAVLHYLTVSKNDMGFMSADISDIERIEVHNTSKQILKIVDEPTANKLLINMIYYSHECSIGRSWRMESFMRRFPAAIYWSVSI